VLSSINHIEAWDGKSIGVRVASKVGVVFPEGNSLRCGASLGGSKRDWKIEV